MKLFSRAKIDQIEKAAKQSQARVEAPKATNVNGLVAKLDEAESKVRKYFSDSPAILITSKEQLHEYVTKAIESKFISIDTETTGLDRQKDYIVGSSLYYPGGVEAYIPNKHRVPIFEKAYKDQLSYEDCHEEFQRIADANIKVIFANADFDLSMIYKDYRVDLCDVFFYDVILAWRVFKDDEKDNRLKPLYNKYVLKGQGDAKIFTDFFDVKLFPYSKPEVAKLYAANDAIITYKLFKWQLPYCLPKHEFCKKHHFENIAKIIWNLEFPLVKICQQMHRRGMYLDTKVSDTIQKRYQVDYNLEEEKLKNMVGEVMESYTPEFGKKMPFTSGNDFNPNSSPQVAFLLYTVLQLPKPKGGGTGKDVLAEINHPIVKQILKLRSLSTLITTFVDKLPNAIANDHKIHANFKQLGASTGRFSSESPNCIEENTLVYCPGKKVPIKNIQIGDLVYCYDKLGKLHIRKILNKWYKGFKLCNKLSYTYNSNNDYIILTPDHKIFIENIGMVENCNINTSIDKIKAFNSIADITELEIENDYYNVYDIEVEEFHNFIANGICVSNCQNIPSKKKDIRHEFRATPSNLIDVDCVESNNSISATLSLYDSIKVDDEYIQIKKLKIGDSVSLLNTDTKLYENFLIQNIDAETELGKAIITIQK